MLFLKSTARFEAPEVIEQYTKRDPNYRYEPASDVFSFAMVLYCIFAKTPTPFREIQSLFQAGEEVKAGNRPVLPGSLSEGWKKLISLCWHQEPSRRPTFAEITQIIQELAPPVC